MIDDGFDGALGLKTPLRHPHFGLGQKQFFVTYFFTSTVFGSKLWSQELAQICLQISPRAKLGRYINYYRYKATFLLPTVPHCPGYLGPNL